MSGSNNAQILVQNEMGQIVYFGCCEKIWIKFQNGTYLFTVSQLRDMRHQLSCFLSSKTKPFQFDSNISLSSQQCGKTKTIELCRGCLEKLFGMIDLACEILDLQLIVKENV
jgi:hypothetical protein